MELAESWIRECESSHEGCRMDNHPALPTRVVDVGSSVLDPHLYISTPGERAPYATLSHCWGGSSPLTTTLTTLGKHVEGIPYSDLPLTLRDAVTVTRALGLKYLWVDSLCIIQDSHDDWVSEATRMASVYENSYVTIAADAASDCRSGFLTKPARIVGPCISVSFDLRDSTQIRTKGILYLREKGSLMRQLPVHGWHPDSIIEDPPLAKISNDAKELDIPQCLQPFEEAPASRLSTRGWVMQERMLSLRTLHFGPSEMGWECRTCISCECTHSSVRSRRGEPLLKGSLVKGDWHKIVKEYTRMSLTVASDRLPALSGLASAMSRQVTADDKYVCGLWRSTIAQDLLWHASSRVPETNWRVIPPRYAPTWSWASLNQSVQYSPRPPKVSPTFQVLDIHCEPTSSNPYGPVGPNSYIEVSGLGVWVQMNSSQSHGLVVNPSNSRGSWPQVRGIHDYLRFGEYRRDVLLFLLIGDGEHHVEGLLLKNLGKQTALEGRVFERRGYAVGLQNVPLRKYKDYSTDSTEFEEVEPGFPTWPSWAGLAEKIVLKII